MNELEYKTRDEHGKDILKRIKIKEFQTREAEFTCKICGKQHTRGVRTKEIVSANFTDWAYVGEYTCEECSKLFSLYFYNYEVSPNGIELFNVREAYSRIIGIHTPPFRIVLTKSQKKHLFYKSQLNYGTEEFAINLEEEAIHTTRKRMRELFDFVQHLITIGQSKRQMAEGELSFSTIQKVGFGSLQKLRNELERSREIQIPLFCGQPLDISEEEAVQWFTTSRQTI